MLTAHLALDSDFVVGDVHRHLFGSFVEHMGRCVYTGIYEPAHPDADPEGHRRDVLELVRELGVSLVRYPGGNFVSGYRWEDGVGPVDERPRRLDTAWHSTETNEHGLGEFMSWSRKAQVDVDLALNLGTRGIQSAIDLWEYCNHPGGTYWSDLRIGHGHPDPFGIRMWCLGNEMDGPWQMGHRSADEYGRLAAQAARALRMYEPDLHLVACGSSSRRMPTFGAWEATVLEHCIEEVDSISAHAYYNLEDAGDLPSFLASAVDMETFIDQVVATADHVAAKQQSRKQIGISFDEWNVWYERDLDVPTGAWPIAPRVAEDEYTVADAVVVGSLLITLLRHSDRVTSACLAQLVNALAPIHTEPNGPAWRLPTFHPFAQTARCARGRVLRVPVDAPMIDTDRYGPVPVVHAVATHEPASDEVVVFAVNRSTHEDVELALRLAAFPSHRLVEHTVLCDDDPMAINTEAEPLRVTPRRLSTEHTHGNAAGGPRVLLPPISWSVLTFSRSLQAAPGE